MEQTCKSTLSLVSTRFFILVLLLMYSFVSRFYLSLLLYFRNLMYILDFFASEDIPYFYSIERADRTEKSGKSLSRSFDVAFW